ncbi:MAG: PA2779 family protein [Deltaproteobacteria bacterium]|jgi:hypothetical protein|nr:PA2779 family protein [Deltaproteobacteria bacterium]
MPNLGSSRLGHFSVGLLVVALALALALLPNAAAWAGFATSVDSRGARETDLGKARQALENKKVSQVLADLGYSQEEVESRLSSLTEEELHALAGQLDQAMIPAGDAGVVVGVGVVLVLVILYVALNRLVY